MTTLLLLRHGETESNHARRIQGQDDAPLTAAGIAGIADVAEKLRGLAIDPARLTTYCSPLPRAQDTLNRLRQQLAWHDPISLDKRLMEIDFGDYTGRPVDEILPHIQHHKAHSALAYPGGESGDALKQRIMAFVDEVRDRQGWVLVMAHFGPIETVLRHYQNIPVSQKVWPRHDQVHRLDFVGEQPRIMTF